MTEAYPVVFGVRHLSPGAAWHLRQVLDARRPRFVLIEGPSDLDGMIEHITHRACQLPIAAPAYTSELPVETLLYPFANYSPEYQALLWARDNDAEARFIDLPSSTFLALERGRRRKLLARAQREQEDDEAPDEGDTSIVAEPAPDPLADEAPNPLTEEGGRRYEQTCRLIAERSGELDYDSYWEGTFERGGDPGGYREALNDLGATLRELVPEAGYRHAETLVREAYMRRKVQTLLDEGVDPRDVVVVVGAFHASVMSPAHPPMSDEELSALPEAPSSFTLMPYSYFRLSSQSGYGAGNHAPAYFELKWACLTEGTIADFPARYLAEIARHMRKAGTFRSTAEVIEGARLASSMARLHDRQAPVKAELRDAAMTLLGQGALLPVAEAMGDIDIGHAIGSLPPGVAQTSIQDDFHRELRRLKLDKYFQSKPLELDLDLRENRRVKSADAAFLDLYRSTFLHRLGVLGIAFAEKRDVHQDSATWSEKWTLMWSPEAEIALVEAVLLGETVEVATAFALRQRLVAARSVRDAAAVARMAGVCDLPTTLEQAQLAIANLAAESTTFDDLAEAAHELALTVRYGDVRRFSVEPLLPLVEQLFREAALHMMGSANCDDGTALGYLEAIHHLNRISQELSELVDEALWEKELMALSNSDAHNPILSGFACALLLERGAIDDDELATELARRLSPGIDADLGAGWFEGLSKRNRYALLSRLSLWRHLEEYIGALEPDEFKRALVFLRRAFESFSAHERRQIAENLGEVWGVHGETASELVEAPLDEEEEKALDELSDFDFGDLGDL